MAMAMTLVLLLVGQMFLLAITTGETTQGPGCAIACSPCKDFLLGEYKGTWYLKAEVDPRCPNMCLYEKDGKDMCFCDPGSPQNSHEYEKCSNGFQLVVTGGDEQGNQRYNSSQTISYGGVCNSPNIPDLPEPTTAAKSVWIEGNTLMLCGGSHIFDPPVPTIYNGSVNTCLKLKKGDTEWKSESESNMKVNRAWFSMNSINGEDVVAAGGVDSTGTKVLKSLEKYSNGKWDLMNITLDNATYGHCAVQYTDGGNSYLMIIGGSNTLPSPYSDYAYGNVTLSVTQIDLTTGRKITVSPGDLPGLWSPACTIDNKQENIYVSGGGNAKGFDTTDVYKFNLKNGTLTLHGHLNKPRWGHTMGVTANGQLIVAGGYSFFATNFKITSEIESSEDGGATWKTWENTLSQKKQYAAMASVPEDTYACQY